MRLVAVAGGQPTVAADWATIGAPTGLAEAVPGAVVGTIVATIKLKACSFQSR